jgi:Flp pilus assembly pilin Flp
MQPVDGIEHPCPSSGAGQGEPPSGGFQQAKRRPRPGVAAIEYCLLLSIILVFLIIAVQNLGIGTKGIFQRMATIFSSESADTGGSGQKAAQDDDGSDDDGKGDTENDDGDDGRGRSQGNQGRGWGWGSGGHH